MRLTSTGLGIGTSSPVLKLDVRSGATATAALLDTTAATAYSGGSFFSGANLQIRSGANATGNGAGIRFSSSNNGALEGMFGWVQNASTYGDFVWQGYNGSYIERMRLDSSGNLGLGVTPSAWRSGDVALDIGAVVSLVSAQSANTRLYNNTFVASGGTNTYKTSSFASYYDQGSGVHRWFNAPSGTAGNAITFTQAMTLDASGNLGIGTTSPSNRLDVASSTNSTIGITRTGSHNVTLNAVAGGAFTIGLDGSGGGTERARIDSSGRFMLGTTSALNSGGAKASIQFAGGQGLFIATEAQGNGQVMGFNYNISTNVGSISITSTATAYNTSSDQRLKENIADANSASTLIDALQVRKFDWKADGSHQRYGFVAQELATVAPEAVYQPEDTEQMMAVDYSKLVPMLVKEIQSLRKRLADAGIA
jgi:hypothetical protein